MREGVMPGTVAGGGGRGLLAALRLIHWRLTLQWLGCCELQYVAL
jgi:hypothetical protein